MASTVKGYAQLANGAAVIPANEEQKVYIGRRTGAVIKINARKDSHGFERIEDYFPDSESEDENKSLYDAKPVKLKPNQYIGRRTGALIEINARKDSHGFELIEDYFPDSIRESDVSTVSNKDLNNDSKMSTSVKTSELNEKSQEEAMGNNENMSQLLEPEKNSPLSSHSKENNDIITPEEREIDISSNSTGTAVKNSVASTEPTPQFFGSKKRLFPSAEIVDTMREKITEAEEDIDIVGVSDDDEEQTNARCRQKEEAVPKTTTEDDDDDIDVLDVDGGDTPCITFNHDKSKGSKVKGGVQEDEEATGAKTKDDTVIVDIEHDSTFVTLGNKSKISMLKSMSHDDLVLDNEESYQMDESVVLEGTKHKAMSPDFGSVSSHTSKNNRTENDVTEDMVKPSGRQTRRSKKPVTRKSSKEQEQEEDAENHDDKSVDQQADDNVTVNLVGKKAKGRPKKSVSNKSLKEKQEESQENVALNLTSANQTNEEDMEDANSVKKATRKSKRSVQNKSTKEKKKGENVKDMTVNLTRLDQTKENNTAHTNSVKKGRRKSKMSAPNKSMKEKENGESQKDMSVNLTSVNQTREEDTVHESPAEIGTRKSKRSVQNKSMKEKENGESQKDMSVNLTSVNQTKEEDMVHESPTEKATRKSKRSVQNKSIKEKQQEEKSNQENPAETKSGDENIMKKETGRKPTRTSQKEQDSKNIADAVEPEGEERIMTRRARMINASNHVNITNTSLNDKPFNKKNGKMTSTPGRRSTRSKMNKSMASDRSAISGESRSEKNINEITSMGVVKADVSKDDIQGVDGGNTSVALGMEDHVFGDAEYEANDTHDPQGDSGCVDTLKDRLSKGRSSTRNELQVSDNVSKTETVEVQEADSFNVEENGGNNDDVDGDDEQESQLEISKKPTKTSKKVKGRKTGNKGAAWRAMLNNQGSDSNHDDDEHHDDGDDHDDDNQDNKNQDDDKNNSKIISNNAKTKSKDRKENVSSSSSSDGDKNAVNKKKPRKRIRKLKMTRRSGRRSSRTNKTTASDVTDQGGTADEGDDGSQEDESRLNGTIAGSQSVDKTINKSSKKRTNLTRFESMHASDPSTPVVFNGSPYVLPPGSVKSILKSSVQRTQSADAKKRRVSIAPNEKGSSFGADDDDDGHDEGGKSSNPERRRKSSVSFAPTPSFRITPDDFSTPEESPGELARLSFVTNCSGFTSEDNTFTPGVLGSASLSLSASSLTSTSDTSSVNESQEITINNSKRKLIDEEEGQDDSGVRRSKRTKVPPLEYWKNERIKYERRQSGWFVSGIEKVPTPSVPKRKPKKPKKEKKREVIGKEWYEEEANDFYDEPADMEEVTYTAVPVVNPDTGEQVELDLVHTPEMLKFVNTSGKPAKPKDALIMDKFMSHNLFGSGQIVLRPGAEKGKQHVRNDTMVFHVMRGGVEVTVHETTMLLRTGSTFFVPTGNWYNIKNVQNSDARLLFVQIKG